MRLLIISEAAVKKSIFTREYAQLIDYLIAARCRNNLNQVDVGKRLGKPQSFVSKYERRERRLDVVEFVKICKVIGIDPCRVIRKVERAAVAGW